MGLISDSQTSGFNGDSDGWFSGDSEGDSTIQNTLESPVFWIVGLPLESLQLFESWFTPGQSTLPSSLGTNFKFHLCNLSCNYISNNMPLSSHYGPLNQYASSQDQTCFEKPPSHAWKPTTKAKATKAVKEAPSDEDIPDPCWAGTYSAQRKVILMLRLTLSGFKVTTGVEVGRKRN